MKVVKQQKYTHTSLQRGWTRLKALWTGLRLEIRNSINLRLKMRKFVEVLQLKIRNLIFKGLEVNHDKIGFTSVLEVNGNIYAMRKHNR